MELFIYLFSLFHLVLYSLFLILSTPPLSFFLLYSLIPPCHPSSKIFFLLPFFHLNISCQSNQPPLYNFLSFFLTIPVHCPTHFSSSLIIPPSTLTLFPLFFLPFIHSLFPSIPTDSFCFPSQFSHPPSIQLPTSLPGSSFYPCVHMDQSEVHSSLF